MPIEKLCSLLIEKQLPSIFQPFSIASSFQEGVVFAVYIGDRGLDSLTGSSSAYLFYESLAGGLGLRNYYIGAAGLQWKKSRHCKPLHWPRWNYCCQG